MKRTSLLLIGFVSLASFALAGTKSYEIVLSSPAKAGSLELPAGDYKMKLDNGNAVFTNTRTNKSVTTPVKIETASKKFAQTAVDSKKDGGTDLIEAIELGGSTTKIEFSN